MDRLGATLHDMSVAERLAEEPSIPLDAPGASAAIRA